MATTIIRTPPRLAMSKDPIWLELTTSLITINYAYFQITISGTTNTAAQTLQLEWAGNDITFTLAVSPDSSGLQLPTQTTGTAADYAAIIAPLLRQNEILHDDFSVSVSGNVITCTYRHADPLDITATTNVTNFAMTVYDSTGFTAVDNLRAVVEIWADTGNEATDSRLAKQHSPYSLTGRNTYFDLAPAFAFMRPVPPAAVSIPGLGGGLLAGWAYQKWYFRYADKYGNPPTAEKLVKSGSGNIVFYGSNSTAAIRNYADELLRHAYFRQDGMMFEKQVTTAQPDWVYSYIQATSSTYKLRTTATWSGGTTQVIETATMSLTEGNVYAFCSGFTQLGLDLLTPPSTDEVIESYVLELVGTVAGIDFQVWQVCYRISADCPQWGLVLLFENGVGGMETVHLAGKTAEGYQADADLVQRVRLPDSENQDAEIEKLDPTGSASWLAHTPWYDDDYYLTHLRQILLANRAWLVDVENERYLPVNVQTAEITTRRDDNDLYGIEVSIRAAWSERAANV